MSGVTGSNVAGCASPPGTSIRSGPGRPHRRRWVQRADVDVMQEIKCRETSSRTRPSRRRLRGRHPRLNQWNGVAIASRSADRRRPDRLRRHARLRQGRPTADLPLEARAIGATVNGVRALEPVRAERARRSAIRTTPTSSTGSQLAAATRAGSPSIPDEPIALMGDWNIAPLDADVWDPTVFQGSRRTSRRPSARRSRVRVARPDRRRAAARARRLHLLGLQAAALPAQRGHAHRLRDRLPAVRRPGDRRLHPSERAQGRRPERPRAGRGRPRPRRDPTTTGR